MTNFRVTDGPYAGMVFTEDITWIHYDVLNIQGVKHYEAGRDGTHVLLSVEVPPGWEERQRIANLASVGIVAR